MKDIFKILCILSMVVTLSKLRAESNCRDEVLPSDEVSEIPGPAYDKGHSIARAYAIQDTRLMFDRGSRIELIQGRAVYVEGSLLRTSNQVKTLKIMARTRPDLQACKVSLPFMQLAPGEVIDLHQLGELRGFAYRAQGNKVNFSFRNGPGKIGFTLECENVTGHRPLTYQAISDALGVNFRFYYAGVCE
jgi:hypothetical protein